MSKSLKYRILIEVLYILTETLTDFNATEFGVLSFHTSKYTQTHSFIRFHT